MSPKIPIVTAKELIRALKRAGFSKDRQKGSRLTLINSKTNKTVTIPVHTGVDIGKGLLKDYHRRRPDNRRVHKSSLATSFDSPLIGIQSGLAAFFLFFAFLLC